MVLLIIIPIKWLFHWEYTQHFQTNPFVVGFPLTWNHLWTSKPPSSSSTSQASPEMCFDALNPFVTAEHFNQLLTSRRWAEMGQLGRFPQQNQGWVRWRIGQKTGSLYPSHFCWFLLLQCANCCFMRPTLGNYFGGGVGSKIFFKIISMFLHKFYVKITRHEP